jgi:UDP-N-acetylmuramate--alanine ligase
MNIYFSGIGGVGIGPLAEIAFDAGYRIQGSDAHEGRMARALQDRGIPITDNQDGMFLQTCHDEQPIDWLVHTSALPSDHPELVLARRLGIKTAKRDELIARIIKEKNLKLIAVAGTHGKTTTTGMLVWTFQQLHIPISYSVGTSLSFGPSGKFDPSSEYFIYECDEFDRNFLHFSPHLSLITSIDYDHPDTYPTKNDYTAAFKQFVSQSDMVIMWHANNTTIQATAEDGWILGDMEVMEDIRLTGAHNRRNATLVAKAFEYMQPEGYDASRIHNLLSTFPGTDRRFERLADGLYTDYGHHPIEIAATLQLAREIADHVILVYQPHQNIRQHEIRHEYTTCFEQADQIYWLPTYLSREDPTLPLLTPHDLIQTITNKAAVHVADLDDTLWNHIQEARDRGSLVLTMGAGSIDGWVRGQLAVKQVANVLVIDQAGRFILQKRDDNPLINNPGMITGFGGAVEAGETLREAAYRELHEETNLVFTTDQLVYHTTIFQPLVNDGTSRWVTYYTFHAADISHLEVYEGQGYVPVSPTDDFDDYNLSPTVRQAMQSYRERS